jgi:hypothetical protein
MVWAWWPLARGMQNTHSDLYIVQCTRSCTRGASGYRALFRLVRQNFACGLATLHKSDLEMTLLSQACSAPHTRSPSTNNVRIMQVCTSGPSKRLHHVAGPQGTMPDSAEASEQAVILSTRPQVSATRSKYRRVWQRACVQALGGPCGDALHWGGGEWPPTWAWQVLPAKASCVR